MATKLFVGGLSWGTTEDALRSFFAQVGPVSTATVITDKFTGKSRGFGFVEMATADDAQRAVQELNGKQLDGRTIVVNEAKPMAPRENRGFSSGDRGRFDKGRDRDRGHDDRGGRNW